jgi:hypothetical protein
LLSWALRLRWLELGLCDEWTWAGIEPRISRQLWRRLDNRFFDLLSYSGGGINCILKIDFIPNLLQLVSLV